MHLGLFLSKGWCKTKLSWHPDSGQNMKLLQPAPGYKRPLWLGTVCLRYGLWIAQQDRVLLLRPTNTEPVVPQSMANRPQSWTNCAPGMKPAQSLLLHDLHSQEVQRWQKQTAEDCPWKETEQEGVWNSAFIFTLGPLSLTPPSKDLLLTLLRQR